MLSNLTRSSFDAIPLFRLEKAVYTLLWIKGGQGKQILAETLHRLFPETVGVCSDTCQLMAYINPRGGVRDVPRPWPEYPITAMVNNPVPVLGSPKECPCFDFLDPEVGGPWRLRGENRHHPFCLYLRGSPERYAHFVKLGRPAIRPDAWARSLDGLLPER